MDLPLEASDKLRLDAEGRVDEEITCRRCGYNLRGSPSDGACPACGATVERSIHGDRLRFCNPAWVCTLASGMNWIVAGIALFIVASVVMAAAEEVGDAHVAIYAEAMRWLFVAAGLICMVGCWKATTPDPGNIDVESRVSVRNVVRVGMVSAFMFFSLFLWFQEFVLNSTFVIVFPFNRFATCARRALPSSDRRKRSRSLMSLPSPIVGVSLLLLFAGCTLPIHFVGLLCLYS